uniref:Uncharacterized protein n=1 Tax=Anguilla anguilla TaxID=7936 RepID=A0A0E9TEW4_ANGAN
MCRSERTNH